MGKPALAKLVDSQVESDLSQILVFECLEPNEQKLMSQGQKIRLQVQGAGVRIPAVAPPVPSVPEFVEFETGEGRICLKTANIYSVESVGREVTIYSGDFDDGLSVEDSYTDVLEALGRTPKVCGL